MFNLSLEKIWRKVVQGQTIVEPVLGGAPTLDSGTDQATGLPAGIQNVPQKQLADRTEFLKWRHQSSTPARRNAIQACKLDTDGIPVFAVVNASPVSANIVANNVTPLVLNFSGGFDEHGPVDYYKLINSNTAITPEAGSGPEYLYAIYDSSTDTVDFQSFATSLGYYLGIETPDPTVYLFWFDPSSATMYKSTGSAWAQIFAIFLGTVDYAFITAILEDPGKDITGGLVPAGTVQAFAGPTAPFGYLLCEGQAVSRSTYRKLYYMFGTSYGIGDSSTTFNLPDLRGRFIRGFQSGGGIDTGRTFGSTQADGVGPHDHNAETAFDFVVWDAVLGTTYQLSPGGSNNAKISTNTDDGGSSIIAETRPVNVAMSYIIKY